MIISQRSLNVLFLKLAKIQYFFMFGIFDFQVVKSFDVADWFVLRQIGKNLNTSLFTEIVDELALDLKKLSRVDNQQILIV